MKTTSTASSVIPRNPNKERTPYVAQEDNIDFDSVDEIASYKSYPITSRGISPRSSRPLQSQDERRYQW